MELPDVTPFLLVLSRTGAWVVAAPVLSAKGMSPFGRLAMAVALALFITPLTSGQAAPGELPDFLVAVGSQVAVGLVLGLLTSLLFTAFEVAGSLADLSGGFSYASIVDPLSGQPGAVMSRLFLLTASTVLFATDAYQTVIAGFVRSFDAVPLDALPALADTTPQLLGTAVTQVLASALQVGGPLLGVLFLTDVALGLAARFVPQANALALALPVKTLVALAAAGATLALLPAHVDQLLEPAVTLPYDVVGATR